MGLVGEMEGFVAVVPCESDTRCGGFWWWRVYAVLMAIVSRGGYERDDGGVGG